jgi:hypothetical protein
MLSLPAFCTLTCLRWSLLSALVMIASAGEALPERTRIILTKTYDQEPGGVLRLVRTPEKGPAEIHQHLGSLERGTLTVAWKQTIERYDQGPKQPHPEALTTVRLLDGRGQLLFHVSFLGEKGKAGGPITATGGDGSLARWTPGMPVAVSLTVRLEPNTVDVAIDGKLCATLPLKRTGALAHVQLRDASGLGLQDGSFTQIIDDVEILHRMVPQPMTEVHRSKPPVEREPPQHAPQTAVNKTWTVPGTVRTSWVGNTFGGPYAGGRAENGFGEWVQNGVAPAAFAVTPDGTAIAGVGWDEAGRCIGLYREGAVNTRLVAQYDMRGGAKAWGFGSSNQAVAAAGEWIFAGNSEGDLLRFRWTPGQLDSHRWHDQLELGSEWAARSLAARDDRLAALFDGGTVAVWQTTPTAFTRQSLWQAPAGTRALCFAQDGSLWVVAGNAVMQVNANGQPLPGRRIDDAGQPTAVSLAPDGRLVVCDNGPRQQVRFYDVAAAKPKLLSVFGDEGGLRSGVPGVPGPRKLYGLMGAGVDARGQLHVACCQHTSSRGTAFKTFDAKGTLLHNLQCHVFTDGYSFEPGSDGTRVVGADELLTLDLSRPDGQEWSLAALTLDPLRQPHDPRLADGHNACGAYLRTPGGRRLLYTIGMQSGGFHIYAFEKEPSRIAIPAGFVGAGGPWGGAWAWSVDAAGDIWCGDAKDASIKRFRFLRWEGERPVFETDKPDSWPAPEGLREIGRIIYDRDADALYLGAYPTGVAAKSWGLIGSVAERYDGWTTGKPTRRWRADLPLDDDGFHPKGIEVAGDYVFVVAVKPSAGRPAVISVLGANDGASVGQMWPGIAVGYLSGWVDISHALGAVRRKDGEYLILVEEDFRGKSILYRWRP